jgi:hypothetical protein
MEYLERRNLFLQSNRTFTIAFLFLIFLLFFYSSCLLFVTLFWILAMCFSCVGADMASRCKNHLVHIRWYVRVAFKESTIFPVLDQINEWVTFPLKHHTNPLYLQNFINSSSASLLSIYYQSTTYQSTPISFVVTSWKRMRANKVTTMERTDLTVGQETSNE